jgi:4-hydroxy-tetrahydrodipicolinate synthase
MKNFKGVFTALITPFQKSEVDYASLLKVAKFQLDRGVKGFVINGTTAESPTLNEAERKKIFKSMKDQFGSQTTLIMGTGTNSTDETIARTKEAAELGADAALVVVPYYNKPPQRGLFEHFKKVAERSSIPVIIYNVPSRTVAKLEVETIAQLSKVKNIIGIKEASGDIEFAKKIRLKTSKEFILLSGDDLSYAEFMKAGGDGIISVGAHILPREFVAVQNQKLEALIPHMGLLNNLYVEANPIPVKMALSLMSLIISPALRLPLVEMAEDLVPQLEKSMRESGLL